MCLRRVAARHVQQKAPYELDCIEGHFLDLIAVLSPCIRPPYYEVDFARSIKAQLRAENINEIHDNGENTGADLARFYSYRMEKGRTGRMLAYLALRR